MRSLAFYWKCDCPGSAENKKQTYFSDKHTPESSAMAREIVNEFLGRSPESFECLELDGNHFAYRFAHGGNTFLLRTDDGTTEDDYMAAESVIMTLLRGQGLPVPQVFATDTNAIKYPVRYQIMEFVPYPTLLSLSRTKTLDSKAMAKEFGRFLAKLHRIQLPGFGFIDTHVLKRETRLSGRDATWQDYFNKCLPLHLGYLRDHQLLQPQVVRQIEGLFRRHEALLDIRQGALLHRDFAYWNILGTSTEIKAVIDWDDAVVGDPADDLGIVNCFNDPDFMDVLLASYAEEQTPPPDLQARVPLYTLRNMLWKAMIRHYMGYFEQDANFFLNENNTELTLKDLTLQKITQSIEQLERL